MSFGSCIANSRGRLDTLPLGPDAGARGCVHPIGPRRDCMADASRPPVPPVPRAPRAKPKASSTRGTMAREGRKENPHVEISDKASSSTSLSQCSEARRPREDSPFAYARKHELSRERTSKENQGFEMGPPRIHSEEQRANHRRFPRAGSCPPLRDQKPTIVPNGCTKNADELEGVSDELLLKRHARRHTLQHERETATQTVEWSSERDVGMSSHARRQVLERENSVADASRQQTFARVIARDSSSPPILNTGSSAEVATHKRKSMLVREQAGSDAHEGHTFSRVLCR